MVKVHLLIAEWKVYTSIIHVELLLWKTLVTHPSVLHQNLLGELCSSRVLAFMTLCWNCSRIFQLHWNFSVLRNVDIVFFTLIRMTSCWRRSLRGHNCQLTIELELSNQRLLAPSAALGMYILPTVSPLAAVFWVLVLRDWSDAETIQTVYVTKSLCINS